MGGLTTTILKSRILTLFFCLSFGLSGAQSLAEVLELGGHYYERDQLDSAAYFYEIAFRGRTPNEQLQGVTGLIKVAVRKAEVTVADSLILVGDKIADREPIDLAIQCKYKTIKGEYYRNNSQFDRALRLQKEVVRESAGLEAQTLIQANALYYAALTFERMSAYDSSLLYVNRAYDIYRENLDTTSLQFSGIYNGLGVCYYRANRLAEAKEFYLNSKAIAEVKLGPVSSDLAMCLNNLSSISRSEENYGEAIAYSQQALKIFKALQDDNGIAGAYYALGVYHYYLGDYGRTKSYMEACIAIREQLFDPDHFSLIGPYEVLGIAHDESGDYQKTLHYLKEGRKKIAANYGAGSLLEGFNFENTAVCFQNIGQLDSALHYIRLANAIIPAGLSPNDYSLAVHYFSYANIHYLLDDLQTAGWALERSNAVYLSLGLDQSAEYAMNLALKGLMYAEKDNWFNADQQFESALEKVRLPGGGTAGDPEFQMTPNSLRLLNEYIDYLYRKYQYTKKREVLQQFQEFNEIYLKLSDAFRKQFIDPYTKSILIKDNSEVYDRNIGIYNRLYRHTKKDEYLVAAYRFSEYGRTCMLRDLQDDKVRSYAGIPDSVLIREQLLKKNISDLNQKVLEYPDSIKLRSDLLEGKEHLNTYIAGIKERYPKYHELKFNSKVPEVGEIQSGLADGQNLVEYMRDDTAYYALLVNTGSRELFHLGNRKKVDQAIKDWQRGIVNLDKQTHLVAGRVLYQILWQPLSAKFSGDRVTIVPVGPLFYLNFETLPSDQSPFLITDYTISYALSFSVLSLMEEKNRDGSVLAIVPGFEDAIKQQYQTALDTSDSPDEAYLLTVRQPWALKLVSSVGKKFHHQALIGSEATETKVKANIRRGNVLYFGTHAIANPADPLRSKLILAKEIGPQIEDGYLHAYEIYGLSLEAEVAVLNACESGLGNLQRGEGMISLAYSIHYAGCPSTVMSLWKVDEKVSTRIAAHFLNYLEQGYPKSQALRQAKLDFLLNADPLLQHPFYWGGMVLMGRDGMVRIEKKSRPWVTIFGLVFLLFSTFLLVRKKRLKISS